MAQSMFILTGSNLHSVPDGCQLWINREFEIIFKKYMLILILYFSKSKKKISSLFKEKMEVLRCVNVRVWDYLCVLLAHHIIILPKFLHKKREKKITFLTSVLKNAKSLFNICNKTITSINIFKDIKGTTEIK